MALSETSRFLSKAEILGVGVFSLLSTLEPPNLRPKRHNMRPLEPLKRLRARFQGCWYKAAKIQISAQGILHLRNPNLGPNS